MRVLLVEDEVRLADNLAAALRDGPGFAVDWAADGEAGDDSARNRRLRPRHPRPDAAPPRRPRPAAPPARSRKDATPVLILTAKEGKNSHRRTAQRRRRRLPRQALRSRRTHRARQGPDPPRQGRGPSHACCALDVELNTLEQTVRRDGTLVDLSPTEYRILEYLIHHPRKIVSKQETARAPLRLQLGAPLQRDRGPRLQPAQEARRRAARCRARSSKPCADAAIACPPEREIGAGVMHAKPAKASPSGSSLAVLLVELVSAVLVILLVARL